MTNSKETRKKVNKVNKLLSPLQILKTSGFFNISSKFVQPLVPLVNKLLNARCK